MKKTVNKIPVKLEIKPLDAVMFLALTVLLILFLIMPALELTQAVHYENQGTSNGFESALELLEKWDSFGIGSGNRMKTYYQKKAEYHLGMGDYSDAALAYRNLGELGEDTTELQLGVYDKWVDSLLSEGYYQNAVSICETGMTEYGLDLQANQEKAYYQWGTNELAKKNYVDAVPYLQNSNGYEDADALLADLKSQLESAKETGNTAVMVELGTAFGEKITGGTLNTAQEALAVYRDWLSAGGTHFIAKRKDGTALLYGSGIDSFSVGEWSDLAGVYTSENAAFGWTNSGNVYATGSYQSSSFGEWSNIIQIVGDDSRVVGLTGDGAVLQYRSGQGTETLSYTNIIRICLSGEGRLALLAGDGTVYLEKENGEIDSSVTDGVDIAFAGWNLAILHIDSRITVGDTQSGGVSVPDALLLYPNTSDVFYINTQRKAKGSSIMGSNMWEHTTSAESCYCVAKGQYWEIDTNCTIMLTETGDIMVEYSYDHLLDHYEDKFTVANVF